MFNFPMYIRFEYVKLSKEKYLIYFGINIRLLLIKGGDRKEVFRILVPTFDLNSKFSQFMYLVVVEES